jgi:hypothetical protein
MNERHEINGYLYELIGEEGCGLACDNADIFYDENGWNLMLEGFMEPWKLGRTVEEAKTRLREYASQGFGMA